MGENALACLYFFKPITILTGRRSKAQGATMVQVGS